MRFFVVARYAALILLAASLSACADLLGPPVVFGTVTYEEQGTLPANARLEVTLVELSRDGGTAETIANTAVDDPSNPPVRFAIAYDPKRIDEERRHAVEAVIRVGDRVLYRSTTRVPVLTQELPPPKIVIILHRVPPPPPPPPTTRLSPAERAVAAIRARLDKLEKITGSYTAGDMDATYEAFMDGDTLIAMREARKLGGLGTAQVTFYYREGLLVAYEEDATRIAPPSSPTPGRTTKSTLYLEFTGGRYSKGRKVVNGTAGQPAEREIRDAVTEGQTARDRLIADAAAGRTSTGLGPLRFGCADGSEFFVTFSRDPLRAVVSAVGHPSAVLLPMPIRAGFRFVDGRTELRGMGREVSIRWDGAQAVHCSASAP